MRVLGQIVGRSRFIVILAVFAVLLIAVALSVLGTIQAVASIFSSIGTALEGGLNSTKLTVEFLEVVSLMLKAVVFYIVGIGLYSLFIAPLNLPKALGVDSLIDLETKVISVVIVILGITFLEHFIKWENPNEIIQFGVAVALVVAALVLFQFFNAREKEAQIANEREDQQRAERQLFEEDREERNQPAPSERP